MAHYRGGDVAAGLAELEAPAEAMIHGLEDGARQRVLTGRCAAFKLRAAL